jgi:hypothetical protein
VSARAELIITNIANALSVPIQAVTTLKGRQVAYVQQGGRVAPVPVKVGLFNTKFIEVVSGLNEGDRVLLSPPFDTQEKDLEGGVLAAEERTQAARTNAARPRPPRATPDRIGRGSTNLAGLPDAPAALDPLAAADRQPEPGAGREGREGRGPRAGFNPEQMLKQYDKDGDGQLSDSERETMRADMAARFGQGRGPGMDREALLKQNDKDGDGELSESERETLRADMAARFGQGRGPGGSRTNRGDMFRRPDGPGGGEPDATGGGGRRGPRGGDRSRTNAPPRPEPENR